MLSALYTKLVIAYDGSELSEKALDTAMEMTQDDEKIHMDVLYVDTGLAESNLVFHEQGAYIHQLTQPREETKEWMDDVKQKLKAHSGKTSTQVLEGQPADTIVQYANDHDTELIIMGSRGLGGLKSFFLGSTSKEVVQKASCPVFIVK